MEAEQPQIYEEDLQRENREKNSLKQQMEDGKSAGGITANQRRCSAVSKVLAYIHDDLLRLVEDRFYELYAEDQDLYQSLTRDQALEHPVLGRCNLSVINSHSRRSFEISSPLELLKLYLTTVKREGKTLKSLMGYDSFRSLDIRDCLHMMSKTYPTKIFYAQTRARSLQVLSIAIAAAHVDGNGWNEVFFYDSFRKLEDFIPTLRPSEPRKAEILEKLKKKKIKGCTFSSVTAGQVQPILEKVATLEKTVTEMSNQIKRYNEEERREDFKRTKPNKDPNELAKTQHLSLVNQPIINLMFENDRKSIDNSDGTSGIGTQDSQEYSFPYQVTAKPQKIDMSSCEDHCTPFMIELKAVSPGFQDIYVSVGSGKCQPLKFHKAQYLGSLDLSGLEAGTCQVKVCSDKDGEHLLGQMDIDIEDESPDVSDVICGMAQPKSPTLRDQST